MLEVTSICPRLFDVKGRSSKVGHGSSIMSNNGGLSRLSQGNQVGKCYKVSASVIISLGANNAAHQTTSLGQNTVNFSFLV